MKRAGRLAATTVFVIAALAAGRAITDAVPTDSPKRGAAAPFVVEGRLGDPVDLRYATVTVRGVRPALGVEGITNLESTPGHFVVVDLEVVARKEPLVLNGFSLLANDGRRYDQDRRWLSGEIPTGVPWFVTAVFEVPADAIEGATFALAKGAGWWEQRRDHVLHVDLDLDEREADAFAANRDIIERPLSGPEPVSTVPAGTVPEEVPGG